MLKKEHVKQASVEKVAKFTDEIYTQVINQINESTGYLNDMEKMMCLVILGEIVSGACKDIIGSEGIEVIFEYFTNEKEKLENERKDDYQKGWYDRAIRKS